VRPLLEALDALLLTRVTTERQVSRRRRLRKLHSLDNLPALRCFLHGPKWRRHFGITETPIAEIDPNAARFHRPGRKLLLFTLEADVRERIQEEIRPGVYAEWSDPRERLPL
jgi:hypothetical protein